MATLRIFVADDQEMVRGVITALLAFHPGWEICGEATDGREAVEKVAQLKPDIVLLDADMPNMSGLEATRQIVQNNPARKIIVLTTTNTDQVVLDVFHAGALGFVLKANATHDLAAAIKVVRRGQTCFTPRFAELILRSCLDENQQNGSVEATLNQRERETVRLLTAELSVTLGHQWSKPRLARKVAKYLAIALILSAAGAWWFGHYGEWDVVPPAVDKWFVSLGLKTPPSPKYDGNPDTNVWIDVQTALYYCPGTPLFGKTRRGRTAKQRDAQMDHFEPASGKACD